MATKAAPPVSLASRPGYEQAAVAQAGAEREGRGMVEAVTDWLETVARHVLGSQSIIELDLDSRESAEL